jgi:3-oxoacyl-[acyl-carrier-protein] synthase-3
MQMASSAITALGTYVPEKVLTNADFERMVDTSDEWIVQRTGIRERRIAADDQFTSDLCAAAITDMIGRYGVNVEDADMVIACTHTPDYPFPSVASQLQNRFGIAGAGAIDLNAACAGFVYGLHMANALIASGLHRKVVVVTGDTMSKITDYTDRTTCILFGDGAGAALVERSDEAGFLSHHLVSDGAGGVHLYRTGLSSVMNGKPLAGNGYAVQNGREVYRWAVSTVPSGMSRVMENASLDLQDADWFIPHSANMRMIESICDKSGYPLERTLTSVAEYGNTSAATVPLALDLGIRAGKVKPGDRLLLYGFGGGLVQAGLLIRWTARAK